MYSTVGFCKFLELRQVRFPGAWAGQTPGPPWSCTWPAPYNSGHPAAPPGCTLPPCHRLRISSRVVDPRGVDNHMVVEAAVLQGAVPPPSQSFSRFSWKALSHIYMYFSFRSPQFSGGPRASGYTFGNTGWPQPCSPAGVHCRNRYTYSPATISSSSRQEHLSL